MSSKWEHELQQIAAVRFRPAIRFSASIRVPLSGHFYGWEDYEKKPVEFLESWLRGAITIVYSGPLINVPGEHSGELLVLPKVQVKHFPNP